MTTYDAIIIGAGLNGLTTAAYLAKAGRRVLVLERRSTTGGGYATEEFHPGFFADAGHIGWFNPQIARDLGIKVDIQTASPALFAPQPDGDPIIIDANPARAAEFIRTFSPADADRWPAFCQRIATLAGFLAEVYTITPPSGVELSPGELMPLASLGMKLRRLGADDMLAFIQTVPMTIQELLDNWFESEALKGAIAGSAVRHVLEGPMASGTALLFLHHQVGMPAGAVGARRWIAGGSTALADALADVIEENRGEIRADAEVTAINVTDGRAVSVTLASGDEIEAPIIASSLDPKTTFLGLVDPYHLGLDFIRKVQVVRARGAAARINLALDGLPDFGTDPANLQGRIAISPSIEYLERAYDAAKYRGLTDQPYLDVTIPSLTDPSLAPQGQHVVSIHAQYTPYHLDGGWDDAARDRLGSVVVDTLSQYAPDLPDRIIGQQVMTPLDLEQTYGWPEGSPYHAAITLDQFLFMRPVAGWAQYDTLLGGLFMCGNSAHPGGGIAGGVGYLAAQRIKKRG